MPPTSTTPCAHSATCMRRSAISRWTCCAAPPPASCPRCSARSRWTPTSAIACIACARGSAATWTRSPAASAASCRPMPMASTPAWPRCACDRGPTCCCASNPHRGASRTRRWSAMRCTSTCRAATTRANWRCGGCARTCRRPCSTCSRTTAAVGMRRCRERRAAMRCCPDPTCWICAGCRRARHRPPLPNRPARRAATISRSRAR